MWFYDFRNPKDHDDNRDDWEQGKYTTIWLPTAGGGEPENKKPKHKRLALLVHGFNNDEQDVREAFAMIEKAWGGEKDFDIRGIIWPSEGNALRYLEDAIHVNKTVPGGCNLGENLSKDYELVVPVAHSMGTVFISKVMEQHKVKKGVFKRIVFMGGDARRRFFGMTRKGKSKKFAKWSYKVESFLNIFSKHDRILHWLAPFMPFRYGKRVGGWCLPKRHPKNFKQKNAYDLHNKGKKRKQRQKVRHSTYKKSQPILDEVKRYILS